MFDSNLLDTAARTVSTGCAFDSTELKDKEDNCLFLLEFKFKTIVFVVYDYLVPIHNKTKFIHPFYDFSQNLASF